MFVAGIDAHTRYVVVVIVDRQGDRVLRPTRIPLGATARLLEVLAPYRPLDAVVETCPTAAWLFDVLTPAGITFVLANARRLRAIAEATYKGDALDAELLARMRLAGLIPRVYATPPAQREWATLIRHREVLVRQRTACANRVHAQLHHRGLTLDRGRLLTRAGRQWVRTTAWPVLSGEQRALVRSHLRLVRGLSRLVRALDRHIAAVAAPIPEATRLRTVPGIGAQRALVLCAEVLPITRFPSAAHLVSYAGLAPKTSQSGERGIRHGELPVAANRWLRGALVRAVVSHAQQAPTSWLTQYYRTQTERLGWPVARIAAARKLARALHAMLTHATDWRSERTDTQGRQVQAPSSPRGELRESHAASTA